MLTLGDLRAATAHLRDDAELAASLAVTMPDGRVVHPDGGVDGLEIISNPALGMDWVFLRGASDLRGDASAMIDLGLITEDEWEESLEY